MLKLHGPELPFVAGKLVGRHVMPRVQGSGFRVQGPGYRV